MFKRAVPCIGIDSVNRPQSSGAVVGISQETLTRDVKGSVRGAAALATWGVKAWEASHHRRRGGNDAKGNTRGGVRVRSIIHRNECVKRKGKGLEYARRVGGALNSGRNGNKRHVMIISESGNAELENVAMAGASELPSGKEKCRAAIRVGGELKGLADHGGTIGDQSAGSSHGATSWSRSESMGGRSNCSA